MVIWREKKCNGNFNSMWNNLLWSRLLQVRQQAIADVEYYGRTVRNAKEAFKKMGVKELSERLPSSFLKDQVIIYIPMEGAIKLSIFGFGFVCFFFSLMHVYICFYWSILVSHWFVLVYISLGWIGLHRSVLVYLKSLLLPPVPLPTSSDWLTRCLALKYSERLHGLLACWVFAVTFYFC